MAISTREFEQLQSRVAEMRTKTAKLEGSVETTLAKWEKTRGTKERDEVNTVLQGLKKELAESQESYDTLMSDLRTLVNSSRGV